MITQKERIMSRLLTFADSEFSNKRRKTRKEIFLSRLDLTRTITMTALTENMWNMKPLLGKRCTG